MTPLGLLRSVLRATIKLGGPATGPMFERAFGVTWEPGEPGPEVRLEAGRAASLAGFVEALRRGAIDFGAIREAAPALGSLLGAGRLGAPECATELLELAADGATTVLTEVPWEAAARGSGTLPDGTGELFGRLLAALPICRLVPATLHAVAIGSHRPRLLLCISNPPGVDGGQIAVGPIQTACEQALQLYPVFQVKLLRGAMTWSAVAPIIPQFQPNVLIVVGHGSSNPEGGAPALAFVRDGDPGGVDRVPVATVAEVLARAGSCCLVALIACDLAGASGYSAACELVRQGVGEVVAMQGSIQQQCARVILAALLAEVLAGATLPSAAAAARRAAMDHPHAILPAVFRASDRGLSASELAPLAALYSRALGILCVRASETRAMLKRAVLQNRVEELLARRGVAAVGGGFGNGSSVVLRAAVTSLLAEPSGRQNRPVLYLDCDRRVGEEPLAEWVSRELLAVASVHPVLRPKSSPDLAGWSRSGDELGTWAVEAEISVILDNVPFHPTEEEKAFVEGISTAYGGPDSRAGLVLGGAGELLQFAHEQATVVVNPLSLPETEAYAKELVPGANAQDLYRLTGGTLLLLDAERRMRTHARRIAGTVDPDADTLNRYLDRLDGWFSPQAREASARLALFPWPLDVRLAEEFVTPDLPGAITELLEAGLAMSFEDRGVMWVLIPEWKSQGLQIRRADDLEGIETKLAALFAERYDQDGDAVIRAVTSLGGAGTYLKVVQHYLHRAGLSEHAVFLPELAQGTALPAIDLFKLFEQSVEIIEARSDTYADVLLDAARAALVVGKPEVAETWMGRLPAELEPKDECTRLTLRAALRKDQAQAEALTEILECYSRATELLARVAPEKLADCEKLRQEIVIDSLPAHLFLAREPSESAAARLGSVLSQVPPQERARLLATLAEREMKEPADKVNWTRVSEWVTEAASLLGGGSEELVRTYCTYQQAQYLRERPEPRFADAWRTYEESKAAGERAGEPRRWGLALLRLIELERDHQELRQEPAAWPARRLGQLDEAVAGLRPARGDALSMRVLGRLQALAATVEFEDDNRRDRLTQAARALATPILSALSDGRRFAEVCVQALELDLGPTGDFLLAQRFLASFRSDISQRLGITVDLERPEASRDAISRWLAGSL